MIVWINNHRHPILDHFFTAVTWAGSLAALLPLSMLILFFLLDRGKAADAGLLGVGFGGAVLLAHLLKMVFGRTRPSLSPVLVPMPTDFSLCETRFGEPGNPATILYGRSTSAWQASPRPRARISVLPTN